MKKILLKYDETENKRLVMKLKSFETTRQALDHAKYLVSNNLCIGKPELIERKMKA